MTEIAATKLSRFGLSADGANCLIEYEKQGGETDRLAFPASQLDEMIGLLLQVKQLHSQKTQGNDQRQVLVAERVGVLVQPKRPCSISWSAARPSRLRFPRRWRCS